MSREKIRLTEQSVRKLVTEAVKTVLAEMRQDGPASEKQIKLIKFRLFFLNVYMVQGRGGSARYYARPKNDRPKYGSLMGPLFDNDDVVKKALIDCDFNITMKIASAVIEYTEDMEGLMTCGGFAEEFNEVDAKGKQIAQWVRQYNGQEEARAEQQPQQLSKSERFRKWSENLADAVHRGMSADEPVFMPMGFLEYTPNNQSAYSLRSACAAFADGGLEDRIGYIYANTEDENVMSEPSDMLICLNPKKLTVSEQPRRCFVIGINQTCCYAADNDRFGLSAFVGFASEAEEIARCCERNRR